jgi:hypothetical protein
MKRLFLILSILLMVPISAYAQSGAMSGQPDQMGQGKEMQMMNCPKMQQMSGQGMMQGSHPMPMMQQHGMMYDMMQIMTDIMNMQEKIITGVKESEKQEMINKIQDMKAKMHEKMNMCKCMMGGTAGQPVPEPSKEAPPVVEPHKH